MERPQDAGGATPIAFLIGGLVAALTAYSYSKLSVFHPSAGGTVSFIDRAFGVNTFTGSVNAVLWAGYVATTALYASAFGHYTATLIPGGTSPSGALLRTLMLLGVAVPWLLNLTDASLVAKSEGVVVAVKLLILGIVIAAGMPTVSSSRLASDTWPSSVGVVAAGMLIFVAYEGFELIANASEDIREPKRNLPLAFGLAVSIVVVLYVAIAVVVVGSLSPAEISRSADFALAEAAATNLGSFGFKLVGLSAMLATLSAINATLYGSARLSYTIASEGELPERFEHLRWNEPVGLHITAGVGLALAVGLPLTSISALASCIFLLVFATVNAAAFRLGAEAGVHRIIAAAGVLGCSASLFVLLVRTSVDDPTAAVSLVALVLSALVAEYLYLRHRSGRSVRPSGFSMGVSVPIDTER